MGPEEALKLRLGAVLVLAIWAVTCTALTSSLPTDSNQEDRTGQPGSAPQERRPPDRCQSGRSLLRTRRTITVQSALYVRDHHYDGCWHLHHYHGTALQSSC